MGRDEEKEGNTAELQAETYLRRAKVAAEAYELAAKRLLEHHTTFSDVCHFHDYGLYLQRVTQSACFEQVRGLVRVCVGSGWRGRGRRGGEGGGEGNRCLVF